MRNIFVTRMGSLFIFAIIGLSQVSMAFANDGGKGLLGTGGNCRKQLSRLSKQLHLLSTDRWRNVDEPNLDFRIVPLNASFLSVGQAAEVLLGTSDALAEAIKTAPLSCPKYYSSDCESNDTQCKSNLWYGEACINSKIASLQSLIKAKKAFCK